MSLGVMQYCQSNLKILGKSTKLGGVYRFNKWQGMCFGK